MENRVVSIIPDGAGGTEKVYVPVSDVLYFQAEAKHVVAVTHQKRWSLSTTLKQLVKDNPELTLVHRSYAIKLANVRGFISRHAFEGGRMGGALTVAVGTETHYVPVSRRERVTVKNLLKGED